jgi:hypothetical protein
MRTPKSVMFPVLVAASITWVGEVAAQQAQAPQPRPVVEIFACNFKNGKGMDDFLAVAKRWNAWADQNAIKDYTAIIMTPYYYSPDLTYDVLWLGATPNGTAMGMGDSKWLTTGKQVQAAFDQVAKCASHAAFSAVDVHRPPQQANPAEGVVLFRDCKVREGRTPGEAIAGTREWSEYMKGRGSDIFSAVLFPLAGQTDDYDYSYKAVYGFQSMDDYGKATDVYTSGGAQRGNELIGRIAQCNSPRVYLTNRIRQAAPAQ